MPEVRWGSVTVDCLDPERLAAFWAALLGTSVRGRWQQYVHLHPVGGQPVLAFQRVDIKPAGKNSLHIDLHVNDEQAKHALVQRAIALGGGVIEQVQQDDAGWVVLADPEENRFCIVAA